MQDPRGAVVGADLGEQTQGAVGADGVELGEIDAGQLVERGANLETRLIVARFLPRPRGGQRDGRGGRLGGQRVDVGLDRRIARGELALIRIEQLEVLLQHEDVLGAVMPGKRRCDLRLRGLTPVVPMLCESVGVRLTRDFTVEPTLTPPKTTIILIFSRPLSESLSLTRDVPSG